MLIIFTYSFFSSFISDIKYPHACHEGSYYKTEMLDGKLRLNDSFECCTDVKGIEAKITIYYLNHIYTTPRS